MRLARVLGLLLIVLGLLVATMVPTAAGSPPADVDMTSGVNCMGFAIAPPLAVVTKAGSAGAFIAQLLF